MAAREPRRSGGRGGFQWDSINHQWIKGARSSSPRVRAAQQYAELQRQEQERQEREEIQLASDAEVLESNAKPPSSTPASSSSDGTPAEAERPSGQRYVRGQDSSTLKVQVASTLEGVPIPIRPIPPESTDCCMSGCPRCVYDVYTEDLQLYHEALSKTRSELRAKGIDEDRWPPHVRTPAALRANTPDSNAESAADRAAEEVSYEIRNLNISLRTFLQFERELRKKRRAEEAKRISLEHVSQIASS